MDRGDGRRAAEEPLDAARDPRFRLYPHQEQSCRGPSPTVDIAGLNASTSKTGPLGGRCSPGL
jgi:hypothetical protein